MPFCALRSRLVVFGGSLDPSDAGTSTTLFSSINNDAAFLIHTLSSRAQFVARVSYGCMRPSLGRDLLYPIVQIVGHHVEWHDQWAQIMACFTPSNMSYRFSKLQKVFIFILCNSCSLTPRLFDSVCSLNGPRNLETLARRRMGRNLLRERVVIRGRSWIDSPVSLLCDV